jgi:hypothetical protein
MTKKRYIKLLLGSLFISLFGVYSVAQIRVVDNKGTKNNIPLTMTFIPNSAGTCTPGPTIVDNYQGIILTQTTTNCTVTLPRPTNETGGKTFVVSNSQSSTNSLTVKGYDLPPGASRIFVWDGADWSVQLLPVSFPFAGSTAPANPMVGETYFNTTSKTLFCYDGLTWKAIISDNFNLSGDVSGPLGSTTIDMLKAVPISLTPLTDGDVLQYKATGTKWVNTSLSSLGSIALSAPNTGSDVGFTSTPVSLAGTITLNVPDAGASSATRGVVNAGAQTFYGAKTFNSAIAAPTSGNTINGLIINGGDLSGITGETFASGNFDQSPSSGTFKTGTGAVSLNGNTTLASGKTLAFTSSAVGGPYTVTLKPSSSQTANYPLTLPTAGGSNGQTLITDGSGNLSWATPTTGSGTNTYNAYWTGTNTLGSEQYTAVSRGGTGIGSLTAHGLLLGNGSSNILALAPGANTYVLTSGGPSADPTWTDPSTLSIPINKLSAATNTNSIDNTNWAQTWNWNSLTTGTGLSITSSSTGLTTGSLASINLTGDNAANAGALLSLNSSGTSSIAKALNVAVASTGNLSSGGVYFNFSGAHSGNGFQIDDITQTGKTMVINANALTTGNALSIASNSTAAAGNSQTLLNIGLSGANAVNAQTTYGAQIANSHTGTNSTNVGLKVSASGGTNNYAIQATGDVQATRFLLSTPSSITGVAGGTTTIDLSTGNVFTITLAGVTTTLAFTNSPSTPQTIIIKLSYTNNSVNTITWPATNFLWSQGTAPALTNVMNKVDIISVICDGAGNYYCTYALNF